MLLMYPRYVREKARPAGDILTVLVVIMCAWGNIENAVIHLRNFGAW